jgi:hypothetical protein
MKNNVLGANTWCKFTIDLNSHVLTPLCDQSLSGKNMLNFTCTNAESQGAKGTVGRGVAITTDNSGAWQSEALLGTNDVDNTLALVPKTEVRDAEVFDIILEGHALEFGILLFDKGLDVLEVLS